MSPAGCVAALLALAVIARAAPAQVVTDTTLKLAAGGTVKLMMWDGVVRITVGDGPDVRVRATRASGTSLSVATHGTTVTVSSSARSRDDDVVQFSVLVPRMARVHVVGNDAEVSADGPVGDVTTVLKHGRVRVTGARGRQAHSLYRGPITIHDAAGPISAITLRGDIEIERVNGAVAARNTDGHVHLADVDGDSVSATSVEGEVAYSGLLRPRGRYTLTSHTGAVRLRYRPDADATIDGFTQLGSFTPPRSWARADSTNARSKRIVLGTGAATVSMRSFRETVHVGVLRPGTGRATPNVRPQVARPR